MDALVGLTSRVRAVGLAAGLDAVGITDAGPFRRTERDLLDRRDEGLHGGMQFTFRNPARSTDPGRALVGASALVVGARSYRREDAPGWDATEADPTPSGAADEVGAVAAVARYSWVDHYAPLRQGLEEVAGVLRTAGWTARVLADDNALVDREAAYRAGLGWYGKNTMLLLHGRGSEFLLGSVVTDAPLAPSSPEVPPAEAAAAGCGTCQRCLPACPTGALVAPGVLDASRCLAWLLQAEGVFPRQHRAALGGRIYGCDACQDVCPPNRLEIRRRPPPPAEAGSEATVALLDLLDQDDDELLRRHGRWYVPRRQARYLRRNALVALGNVAVVASSTKTSPATPGTGNGLTGVLRRHLSHPDPLVRAHAVWATARLGRLELLGSLVDVEEDPLVRAELGALPPPRQA